MRLDQDATPELVELLVRYGAKVNAANEDGETPLLHAVVNQRAASFKALESARGFVWSWLRRHLDLRATPELLFRPDRSMEHAAHIQTLLADLKARGESPSDPD